MPTIDFETEEERDRGLRMLKMLDQLGGEQVLRTLSGSERSGVVSLEEVTRRMRELTTKLRSDKDGGES